MDLLDVGCGPGTITVDLAARVAPGPGARHRRLRPAAGRGARAGRALRRRRHLRGRRRLLAGRARRLVRRRPRPPGAAAPDRPGRGAARDGPGVPARRRDRGAGRRLRGAGLVPGGRRPRSPGSTSTSGCTGATAASRTPGRRLLVVGARGGPARRRRDDELVVLRVAGGPRVVGHLVGRPGDRRRRSPSRPWSTGWPRPSELTEIAKAWLRWAAADDGWLGMLHGELLIRV